MKKGELVAMFMESPFYFELTPRERLSLLEDHRRRFAGRGARGPHYPAVEPAPSSLIAAGEGIE